MVFTTLTSAFISQFPTTVIYPNAIRFQAFQVSTWGIKNSMT